MAQLSRRGFLKAGVGGGAALTLSAAGYGRIKGANDRLSIALIGCGRQGLNFHVPSIARHAEQENAAITVVCDPWRVRRELAGEKVREAFGHAPRMLTSYREVMQRNDVDAVIIASCDHQHTTHLKAAAEAGKDAYCEKPLAKNWDALKQAYQSVKESGIVVQAGTQLRSLPSMAACRQAYRAGLLGTVGRIEQCRNQEKPYWYDYIEEVRQEDVDWQEFLMDSPAQSFNASKYSAWYGYRDFSDGPVPNLGSHYIDLVHYITGARFPSSCVCHGGTFTYKDEHRFTCPDHVQAMWVYPEGFMVSYSSHFGNSSGNSFKMLGDEATLDMLPWTAPVLSAEGATNRAIGQVRGRVRLEDVPQPDHHQNWLQCIRTRQAPNADIEAGFQHAVACLMAVRALDTGKRMTYDPNTQEIMEG